MTRAPAIWKTLVLVVAPAHFPSLETAAAAARLFEWQRGLGLHVPDKPRGTANSIATILPVAMMLEWLEHPNTIRAARQIMLADSAHCTCDLGGKLVTREMGELIRQALA